MALKSHYPDITFSGNKITSDELGWDQQYIVINPSISATWFGTTAVGTAGQSKPFVGNILTARGWADYPRNAVYAVAAAGGSTHGGTWTVNGIDQFGSAVSETVAIATATGGGTVEGTQVFSRITSGTYNFANAGDANGTPRLGVAITGTTALFGLPVRLGGSTDIKYIGGNMLGVGTQTNGTQVFNGTPSSAAHMTQHAFKAPETLVAGTTSFIVRYRSSYVEQRDSVSST